MPPSPQVRLLTGNWHRWIGIGSALFLVICAITGILLNHTDRLRLGERHLSAPILLRWYGIEAPAEIPGYQAGPHWFFQAGDQLFFDGAPAVEMPTESLVGATWFDDLPIAATGRRLHLLTPDGQLVEQIGSESGLPEQIARIGLHNDHFVVADANGASLETADFATWQPTPADAEISWSTAVTTLPPDIRKAAESAHLGAGVTVERFMLDLHSGRILGSLGPLLMDAAAIAMILLTLSGLYLHLSRPKRS